MAEARGFDGRAVLVTGGAGFIGSNFVRRLLGRHPGVRVVNLDKLTYAGNLENLRDLAGDPRHEFVKGDIRDAALVGSLLARVQGVVHFAAETHVDRSIVDAGEFVLTDVHGTYVLLEALRKAPHVEVFVHLSTDEVYGSRDEGLFREDDPINPSSPYAASKAGADRLVHAYRVTYGAPVVILRPSNNFGPYQYPEKLIPLFATNALEGKPLPLYGAGTNVRDWLFVEDCCRAVETAYERAALGEAYNVGGGNEVPNVRVAERILEILGKPRALITPVADRPGHDRRYALDSAKMKALGWAPEARFDEALERTVRWYEANEPWWRAIKEKSRAYKEWMETCYSERK